MQRHITLHAIALAAALAVAGPAAAFETYEFGPGIKLDARVNLTYTLAQRIKHQDALLASPVTNSGGNDGNNNFDRGSLTANRIGALLDAKLSYKQSGLVYSGSIFYDDVYHGINDNNPGNGLPGAGFNPNAVNKAPPFNRFTDEAERYHGGYARNLDVYGYTSFNMGETRATVRLGRHVVNWGEALFFPSIGLAQGPADGTKTGVPGTETKDQLLPEDQISAAIEVTPRWTLLGHVQFGFHETLAQAPGSFMSASDVVGQGATCLGPWTSLPAIPAAGFAGFTGCSFGNRLPDVKPGNTGQWGVGTRFRITDETEVGLYYLNYHDRTPLPEVNSFTPGVATPIPTVAQIGNGSYRVRYFDDVKLIGATYSTTLGLATVTGELSYKDNAPVLVTTLVNPAAPNNPRSYLPGVPTRGKITQLNIGTFANLGNTPIARSTTVLGEVAAIYVGEIEARKAPGVENLPAANQAFFPASSERSFGTRKAIAANLTVILGYPGIFEGWDLTVPISYQQQFRGRTITGGLASGGEGDKRYSIGATMVYGGNLSLALNYAGFLGDADVSLRDYRPFADRDQVSFIAKYSF